MSTAHTSVERAGGSPEADPPLGALGEEEREKALEAKEKEVEEAAAALKKLVEEKFELEGEDGNVSVFFGTAEDAELVPLSELILGRYLPQNEGLRARARRNGCGLGMQGVVKPRCTLHSPPGYTPKH